VRPALVAPLLLLILASSARADPPLLAPPAPDAAPPPPVVEAAPPPPALPAGVTPIVDARDVTFVLTGGNRVVGRRIGEDPEFIWIEANGRQARVRKSEIATMDFRVGVAPPPPTFSSPRQQQPPPLQFYVQPTPAPRGRGMVIWGGVLLGVGYTIAIAAALDDSTGTDGSSLLLAIPVVGPFLFAATDAAESEPAMFILDGLMQAGGVLLLYIGIRRLQERPEPVRDERPRLVMSVGPHRVDAGVRWTL
jgi:hypothetical protein